MHSIIMSHSKQTKAVVPKEGALLNPPVPAGVTLPTLAETTSRIKTFTDTRTFTKQTWSSFLWAPNNPLRSPNAEDVQGAVGMTQKTLDFWLGEMNRFGLNSSNGLPDPGFVHDGQCQVFQAVTTPSSLIADDACGGSGDVQKYINQEFPGALSAMPQENLVGWAMLDGYGPGTAKMFTTPEYTYPDEAAAEAAHKWQFQRGGEFFTLIGDRAWMPMQDIAPSGQIQFWRKSSPIPGFWKRTDYPWLDLGPYCTSIADAISKGPQPAGGYITIKEVGCFQNTTGAAATFDINTWSAFKTKYGEWFIACAHGRIAIMSTGLSRLRDGGAAFNGLANHEVGHNLGTGHNSNGPGKPTNPSSGSSHYAEQEANFGQAAMVYVSKNHLGVSNIPTDYNNPIWNFDTPVIGPSDDGSIYPTISGNVATSNQADVPLFAVVAYVQRVYPDTKTLKSPGKDDLSEYSDSTCVGCLIKPDGSYSIKLEHFAPTGTFYVRSLIAINLAGVRKDIPRVGFVNDWSY